MQDLDNSLLAVTDYSSGDVGKQESRWHWRGGESRSAKVSGSTGVRDDNLFLMLIILFLKKCTKLLASSSDEEADGSFLSGIR